MIEYKNDVFKKIPNDQPGYYNWVGKESHYLTVIDAYMRVTEGKLRQRYFLCKCKCGNEKLIHGDGIRKGRLKSCGCWKPTVDAQKAKQMGEANKKHGMSGSRIYGIWNGMIDRCTNKKSKDYKDYGARGITVCEKWRSFDGFYEDMTENYADHLTIDRIDVNGNYEKSNCRWVTIQEQASNKRNTIYLEFNGKKMKPKDWAKELNMVESTIISRFRSGKKMEDILSPELKRKEILITYNGKTLTPEQWSEEVGIPEKTIRRRYFRKWPPEKMLNQPVKK